MPSTIGNGSRVPSHMPCDLSQSATQAALDARALSVCAQYVQQRTDMLCTELARRGVSLRDNEIFTFHEIAARGRHRFDARLDLADPAAHGMAAVLGSAPWLTVVHAVLGDDLEVLASVVFSLPGADSQVSCANAASADCARAAFA
jgi:hypothetical protein